MSLAGCRDTSPEAPSVTGRLQTLEAEEHRQEERLAATRREIETAEHDLARARTRALFMACHASMAARDAEASRRVAECAAMRMRYSQCIAVIAEHQANATLGGMLLGGAAAFVTGGVAAPFVLAGGVGGHTIAGAARARCGEAPACPVDPSTVGAAVSAERGVSAENDCATRIAGYESVGACDLTLHHPVHLRPQEMLASRGPELPAESAVSILESGAMMRGPSRMFRARAADGMTGWVFLDRGELRRGECPWSTQ